MNKLLLLLFLLGIYMPYKSILGQDRIHPEIDAYIQTIQKRNQIPGIAVAIIKDGKLIHKQNYGYANLEHQVAVGDNSIFRLYSLTKPIVAVSVFRLIEEGKISLEDNISDYVFDLPESWQPLQIKHLLSFSSGLPDMGQPYPIIRDLTEAQIKERIFPMPFSFDKGERFEYSQTNFFLLQKIVEQVSQTNLAEFVVGHQFSEQIDTVFFSSDSREIIRNRATPYFPFATGYRIIDHPQYPGTYTHASNGLHVGLADFIVWDKKFREDQFISQKSKQIMWESFPYTQSDDVFAHGWGKYEVNGRQAYGFSGSGCTLYRIFPEDDLSIIFLSNGFGRSHNLWQMASYIAFLADEYIFEAATVFTEKIREALEEKGHAGMKTTLNRLRNQEKYHAVNVEGELNGLGYTLFYANDLENAIEVFTLNAESFPNSWNAFDSLGEAYEQTQNYEKAMRNYERSIQLNTQNENDNNTRLKDRIKQLRNN